MKPDPLSNRVYNFSKSFITPGTNILVAVSGGSDSVALLLIMHGIKRLLKLGDIGVAHLNHGLRGADSDADEQFVKQLAVSCGCECFSRKVSDKSPDAAGIEAWARNERYAFFHEIMLSHGYRLLATGHTADDQAETVLMRLFRGTGIKGIRGIAALREDGVFRPLLQIRKKELEQWLIERKQTWKTDLTNADTRMQRNWVRGELIPIIESHDAAAIGAIASYADQAQRQWEILGRLVNAWVREYVSQRQDDAFIIAKDGLDQTGLASEAVAEIAREYGIQITEYHIEQVLQARALHSGILLLPDGWRVTIGRKSLKFIRPA